MKSTQRLQSRRRILLLGAILAILTAWAQPGFTQDVRITGRLVSAVDGGPLVGVSVLEQGTNNGVTTNTDGQFVLQAPLGSQLVFSFVGYVSKTLKAATANMGTVKLDEDAQNLNSVVVVGYGTQKKMNLTGAISILDLSEKEGQPITNVSNALHGMPGLFVNLGNSQPGVDRSSIHIRGFGTLNNSSPLVLVNGVEYNMDELNPNDIETVTVLKDAAAAIYGSRAANGVIIITTKSGKGTSKVNYSYYYGEQKPTYLPDAIWDPITYMKLKNQAELNEGKTTVDYSDADIAEYEQGMKTDPITYPSSNWFDIALGNGVMQKHDISFSGSSDKYAFRLALGYLNRDGVLFGPGNHENKYSIGLNASVNLTKRLTVGTTINGYYRNYTEPLYDKIWQYLSRTLPIMTDTLADGRYGNSWLRTPGRNNWEHPRMLAYNGYSHKYIQRFLSTVYADYKLPFDITYNIKFGVDKYDGLLDQFTPQMQTVNPKTLKTTNWNSPATAPRSARTDYNDLSIHFYNTLTWKHQFAAVHNVDVMVGGSYDKFGHDQFAATMTGYLDATLTALDAGTIRNSISGNSSDDVLESNFGRLHYDYDGKYLIDGTFRYDGSGRFATGNRWSFFPSVMAAWRLDREDFFKSNLFDLVKIRASYGQMGNQAVDLYSYEPIIRLGQDYSFNNVLSSGAASTAYNDPGIHWETTTTLNAGIDLALWSNKIGVSVDVYKKRTTDILRTVNIPAQVGGLSGPKRNVGTVDNTGIELALNYKDRIGDITYGFNGNISYNKNEVVDLKGQILYDDGTNLSTITMAGYPMNSFYLYQAEGIFQNQQEIDDHATQAADVRPGYIRYVDQNKDGQINGDDRVIINSSSIMPKYTFGFNVNVGYKGVSLSAFFQGVAGIKVYPTANLAFPFNNGANATWEWLTDSWTPDRPNARLPIVTESNYGSKINYQPSTFWLRDGSYLRMKNIQLAYELPAKWLSKAKLSRVNIFLNAENWVTFSKYKDFDPETIVNASTIYHYPMLKTINGGVNITF